MNLPSFIIAMLNAPPRAGQGVHRWLFNVARQLHAHLPAPQIADLLAARLAGCGRLVPRREIEAAIANSISCAWKLGSGVGPAVTRRPPWPQVDAAHRDAVLKASCMGLADLWEQSPHRFEDNGCHTELIIDTLFPRSALLCCAWAKDRFETRSREAWSGQLGSLAQIVPSPMTRLIGITKSGKQSYHTLENTGPRRFLVVEFDYGSLNDQAALLLHLADYAPLACVVFSGSRSLHGWFFTEGQTEDRVHRFFAYAVAAGADPAMWVRSQFTRMPDGLRENGKRQVVYYFAPGVLTGGSRP